MGYINKAYLQTQFENLATRISSVFAKKTDIPNEMTGATTTTAGTSGLVPAPTVGDNTKYLRGDGTWAEQQAVSGDILDTLEEIEANTESGKIAGALALKETNERLINEDGETFNYGVKDGVRGFYTDPSRADDSFVPFSSKTNMIILSSPTSKTYEIVSDYPLNYVISSNYYSTGWMSSNVSPDGVERWMSIADTWKTTQYSNTYPIVSDDKKNITVRGIITGDGQPNTIIVYG